MPGQAAPPSHDSSTPPTDEPGPHRNGDSSFSLRRLVVGAPRDLSDTSIFHRLSLIPFLAWVGLGADGLSSSAYGPEEAFRTLGEHTYLALGLAALTATTVFMISAAYSRIIEQFPHGGGGYVVATKLLGERVGVISGSALLVDYVLTITVSIAAAGDALFSFVPASWLAWKPALEIGTVIALTTLNIRGVKESVLVLAPIFVAFVITHVILIAVGVGRHIPEIPHTTHQLASDFRAGWSTLGAGGMLLLFAHAYSLGGGTYTGIEAVSNGLQIMREPKVPTARRTMLYMATSLAFTATGLLVCYLLWDVHHEAGKTMNAVLIEKVTAGTPFASTITVFTLITEGALLVVAAQAGFLDGPRVLANMAVDSWVPRRFAAVSERLTTQDGIVLMGTAALGALLYTHGSVSRLVVMYSINVFLTFSLSMFGMLKLWWQHPPQKVGRKRSLLLFGSSFLLCATILVITVMEKFREGGWITLFVTTLLVLLCYWIRGHYRDLWKVVEDLFASLRDLPASGRGKPAAPDPNRPTAAVLVASFGGLGLHTVLNLFRAFPGHFENLVFISVGVVDSGAFKGEDTVTALEERTRGNLQQYVDFAERIGMPATYRFAVGIDPVEEAEKLCLRVLDEFPKTVFFAGKVIFRRERWYQRILHNETALALQKRLQWDGHTMVIIPARIS
ncbi:MAG: APC family permease [bacterium]